MLQILDLYFAQWNLGEMEDINDSWPLFVAGLALYLSLVCATHHVKIDCTPSMDFSAFIL
jgi:hypothetical protein